MFDGAAPSIRSFIEVAWAVPKQSEYKDLATKFIEYVTAGGGVDAWSDTLFVAPAKIGATIPDGVFSSDAAKASYEELASLLLAPGSDRNKTCRTFPPLPEMRSSLPSIVARQLRIRSSICRPNGIAGDTPTPTDLPGLAAFLDPNAVKIRPRCLFLE